MYHENSTCLVKAFIVERIWEIAIEKGIQDAKLCIIGKGWKEVPRNTYYYGFIDKKKKKKFGKVFVFPSLYKGFSLATAEALASYLPVITWI